jgi:cytochrome P450
MTDTSRVPACPFQLMGPDVAADPHPHFAQLRASAAPLHRDEQTGVFVVSHHEHLLRVVRDPETFSNRYDMTALRPGGLPPSVSAVLSRGLASADTLLTNDPPDHARYRRLVERVFTAERVTAMEGAIERIADELIDGFIADGRAEIVAAFCAPLPLAVIVDALGFPREDVPKIKLWSDSMSLIRGNLAPEDVLLKSAEHVLECQRYLLAACEDRRSRPREDLVTALVHARLDNGRGLDERELYSLLLQLMVAGNESCTNAMAGGVRRLAEDAELARVVTADLRAARVFVEEVLRLESPAQGHFRRAVRDAQVGGCPVPAGGMIHLRWASANRDERIFPAPDALDLSRRNATQHVAFGAGPHFCIGASLGRAELRIGLMQLARRLPGLKLSFGNDFACHPIFHLRGLRRLEVEWEPGAG